MTKLHSSYSVKFPFAKIALLALAISSAALLASCGQERALGATAAVVPVGPPVSVAEVVQKQITDYQQFNGRVEAVERVELRPRVSGYIDSVNFVEGSEVKKGDVLFVIDQRPYDAALKRARAELARAQSALQQMQTERDRSSKLLALHAQSQEEFDARVTGSDKAAADVQVAQAALDLAALDMSFTQIRAPISGRVSKAGITAGNYVKSGETVLTRLVSLDPVYVSFEGDEAAFLHQSQLAHKHVHTANDHSVQPVWIGLASEEGHPHAGELVFMNNELDAATGTIGARAKLNNSNRLFTPGMFARVKLEDGGSHAAVLVRDSAVGTDQNRRFVLVVTPQNTAEYRAVELGPLFDDMRVVRSGLAPGEVIVVNGLQRVRPGSPISPERVVMQEHASSAGSIALAGNNAGSNQ